MAKAEPCPYKSLPAHAYWRRSFANVAPADIDFVVSSKFKIGRKDRIATAGSCFAQHIARYLAQSGFNYLVTEPGHAVLGADLLKKYNYGTFSARFGNVYTARQFNQLLLRAHGEFTPAEDNWAEGAKFIDPFRPFIQPNGFASLAELHEDRAAHFRAIRKMVEEMTVLVFTLGLTETWVCNADGAALPVCPGCGAGQHDSKKYAFKNLNVAEVIADLEAALAFVWARNPKVKVILTVSPVPLIATYEKRHVAVATSYSKSVLRVAADTVAAAHPSVDYFPSYEFITGAYNAGAYYEEDLREVREEGVAHVMGSFFRHYVEGAAETPAATATKPTETKSAKARLNERVAKVVCDEELMELGE